jgi:hypothetical protein
MFCFLPGKKKKASSVKQADLRNILKKASNDICTSTVVLSPVPLPPAPSASSSYEDSRKQRRTVMTLNHQMIKKSKWNTPLIGCAAQV